MKEKIQRLIEQRISEWQEEDIYAISLYVFDEEDLKNLNHYVSFRA